MSSRRGGAVAGMILAGLAVLMLATAGAVAGSGSGRSADAATRGDGGDSSSWMARPSAALDPEIVPGAAYWSAYAYLPIIVQQAPPPTPTPVPGWQTLMSEGFEGAWPSSPLWRIYDGNGQVDGEYAWARRNCRAIAGSYSVWAVGGGYDGARLPCGANYPDMAESWMVYGPFSLQESEYAYVIYNVWMNNVPQDGLCQLASVDGVNFAGDCTTGGFTRYWMSKGIDFDEVSQLGDLNGKPHVWFALVFVSGLSDNTSEGAYVDNILLRTCRHHCEEDASMRQTLNNDGMAPAVMTLP